MWRRARLTAMSWSSWDGRASRPSSDAEAFTQDLQLGVGDDAPIAQLRQLPPLGGGVRAQLRQGPGDGPLRPLRTLAVGEPRVDVIGPASDGGGPDHLQQQRHGPEAGTP